MVPEVMFTPFESSGKLDSLNRRVAMMLNRSGFYDDLKLAGDEPGVAVKVHPGERGSVTYLRPSHVRSVADQLIRRGARPFVTETTTLYCRERFTEDELLETASWNGFSNETMGCPFEVADSVPDVDVVSRGERLDTVGVAGRIAAADALVLVTHPTLHPWTAGFAGTLKNLGMGCTGRRTKAETHLSTSITIDERLCNACGKCAVACKSEGIRMTDECAVLTDNCVRCGVCIGSCPQGAIGYSHDYELFAEALAEAAGGVLSVFGKSRVLFVSYLLDVTWHCDCEDYSGLPVVDDIGVLVSRDPVAIDQATADLLNGGTVIPGSRADREAIRESDDMILELSGVEWWKHLEYAESLGLGSRAYRLRKVSK